MINFHCSDLWNASLLHNILMRIVSKIITLSLASMFVSTTLRRIIRRWPGQETFGFLSFLPVFFVLGAGLEFCMIKWRVNDINFYDTYKKRLAIQIVDQKETEERNLKKTN